MLWEEDKKKQPFVVPDEVADLVFKIDCKQIALDHAYDLSQAILQELPWMADEEFAGIHTIHGASTGNGWQRPDEDDGGFIYLSHRSKMHLRLPKSRHEDARALVGKVLQVGDSTIKVGKYQLKPFSPLGTQFSRYVVLHENETEQQFIERMVEEMAKLDIRLHKALCGTRSEFETDQGKVQTVNFMVADLNPDEAVRLQKHGIGEGRKMGFGLFIPHKGIDAVGGGAEQTHFDGTS